jgi:hypothetical protein
MSGNLFPFEIGLGGLIVAVASFLLGREFGRMSIPRDTTKGYPPVNPIRRLDELEVLRDLGILTKEDFESEKHKLRTLWTVSNSG